MARTWIRTTTSRTSCCSPWNGLRAEIGLVPRGRARGRGTPLLLSRRELVTACRPAGRRPGLCGSSPRMRTMPDSATPAGTQEDSPGSLNPHAKLVVNRYTPWVRPVGVLTHHEGRSPGPRSTAVGQRPGSPAAAHEQRLRTWFGQIARVRNLLCAVGAPRGRHRAAPRSGFRLGRCLAPVPPCPSSVGAATSRAPGPAPGRAPGGAAIAPTVRCWYAPIDGTSIPLVRPYLTAHERDEKVRGQRMRRDILWCATYGVDLDMRDIHAGLGVAS